MEEKTMTINELMDRIYKAQALAYQQVKKYIDEFFDKVDDLTHE